MENRPTISDEEFQRAVGIARKQIMDLIESCIGETEQWPFVRSRILRILGRDGLESLIDGTGCESSHQNNGKDHYGKSKERE